MNKPVLALAICVTAISMASCSNQVNDRPKVLTQPLNQSDSLAPKPPTLTKTYTQAITAYINAVHQKDQSRFDTLFLGKRPDFPDLDLPDTISGVNIRVLEEGEINRKKLNYQKTTPYINLIGFVETDAAEFIFVTFYPEFNHQYDCYLNFKVEPGKKEFVLEKSRIEVLVPGSAGKPGHYAVYENGKYTGDKPIK